MAACKKVARQNGVTNKNNIVTKIQKVTPFSSNGGHRYEISLKDGGKLTAMKVVVACGSFVNHHEVLSPNRKVSLAQLAHTVLRFEVTGDILEQYRHFPTLADVYDRNHLVYILPPIRYPDGKLGSQLLYKGLFTNYVIGLGERFPNYDGR